MTGLSFEPKTKGEPDGGRVRGEFIEVEDTPKSFFREVGREVEGWL